MIKILLCCEGNLDKGGEIYTDNEYINADGVIQILISKLSIGHALGFVVKNRQDIRKKELLGPKHSTHSTVARKLAQLAKDENCRYIIYHQDEDNKGLENIYRKVHSYFSAAAEKGISCLAIVPQHMTESWLLSDANAYEQVFGKEPMNPALPSKPEEIWGNNHPKKFMAQVLSQYNDTISPEIYAEIAEKSKTNVMRIRCPESFDKKFYADMQSFIAKDSQ